MRATWKLIVLVLGLTQINSYGADWSPRLAADYLDGRQKEWFVWKAAAASGGPCVSCHTGITYLMARPQLRRVLGESQPTQYETGLLNALRARVEKTGAKEISPGFSKEPMASQAIGVESIFAALFLAREDEARGEMGPGTLQAFDRLWRLQQRDGNLKGAWRWFELNLDPYETSDSPFFGATLAALAVGSTPVSYREQKDVQERIAALTGYLAGGYATQPLHNRLMLAWASKKLRGILSDSALRGITEETRKKQRSDGSWSIESLGPWKDHPAAKPSSGGDGYATAFATFTLQQAGVPMSDPRMSAALAWLRSRQDPQSGYWASISMNKQYPPGSMPEQFMRDAATAFAALALAKVDQEAKR